MDEASLVLGGGGPCFWSAQTVCGMPPKSCGDVPCAKDLIGRDVCPGTSFSSGVDIAGLVTKKQSCVGTGYGLKECLPNGQTTTCGRTTETCTKGPFCQANGFGQLMCTTFTSVPETVQEMVAFGDMCGGA